jgi:3-(3-hydroxy-phenyl)propionate hydroxylase
MSRVFRDAVLDLAAKHAFARRLVNSGRLSMPTTYRGSALDTPDVDAFATTMAPGAPAADAPVQIDGRASWLLDHVGGRPAALYFVASDGAARAAELDRLLQMAADATINVVVPAGADAGSIEPDRFTIAEDTAGLIAQRYDATPGTLYLLRPDQHVAARWRHWDENAVAVALRRLQGQTEALAHAA